MIGTMNIPTDSPKEYYASRRRFFTEPSQSSTETNESCSINKNNNNDKNNNNKNVGTQKTIPTIKLQRPTTSSIFCRRQKRAPKIGYLSDGRKLSNGQLVYPVSASSLWRQLIVRTFVHKMEDEIPDPVEQIAKLHDSFPKLSRGWFFK
uniref:Uncharacterized protein n=1 Tax=Panagrolaimus sp. ES5 TaxID=591445 RepID=A0AC34FJX0_9BILA